MHNIWGALCCCSVVRILENKGRFTSYWAVVQNAEQPTTFYFTPLVRLSPACLMLLLQEWTTAASATLFIQRLPCRCTRDDFIIITDCTQSMLNPRGNAGHPATLLRAFFPKWIINSFPFNCYPGFTHAKKQHCCNF